MNRKGLVILLVSILIIGCGSKEEPLPWNVIESNINIEGDNRIKMKLEDATISPTGANIKICNNSDTTIYFGTEYFIQIYMDKEWYDIDAVSDWTLESFELKAGQEYSFQNDWTSYYGTLPSGKYRIIKAYNSDVEKKLHSGYVFCTFDI